jgi:glycosyltransferase involved in cell wall biosynthesis
LCRRTCAIVAERLRVAVTVEQSWHVVPGGIATATVELLRALVARGDLDLVGVAARHRGRPSPGLEPPVPVRQLRLERRALYETWQRFRVPLVERATGPVDIVHDAGYVVPPSRAPLIATVHDLLFRAYPEHYTWHSRQVFRRGFELARRHARIVICPSRATEAACVEAGIDAERLRVVPLGVRRSDPDPEREERVRGRYGIVRPYVLFCGTIEPRKNLRRVIEAFRGVDDRDVELVIAGPQGWKEDLEGDLSALNGRARAIGFVARDDLDVLYAGAAAVVYPSLAEGFGLPVLEAMANGAPVVTSLGTATEEVAGDAALLVDPLDVDAIGGAIQRLLDDRGLAAELGSAARARASAYTWTRSAELVAGIYAEVADAG